MQLNGGKDDVEVVEDGSADGKERSLKMRGAGGGRERFQPDTPDGCELGGSGDNELKVADGFVGKDVVRREVWEDVLEGARLE